MNYTELQDLWARLRAENSQRNGEYDISRQRVDGRLWGDATNPTPRNRYSIPINYLLPITEKHVQLLMGRMPGIQVMPVGVTAEQRKHAEKLEGVLYAIWDHSNAHELFQRVAWDSFVLRRGLVYYWWNAQMEKACFKYCTPDDFYPEYDGDKIYHAIYVHRRHIDAVKKQYPTVADRIFADPAPDVAQIYLQDTPRMNYTNYVTILDYYDADGNWMRTAGDAVLEDMNLAYPEKGVPFVEFPYRPSNGNREPRNGIDQLVELVQYLCQLVSQKADIIRTYANPTIVDEMSGQSPEEIRRAVSADGSVLPVARDGKISFLNWEGSTPTIDEQIELIMDTIFDISGKPRSAFGQTITNQSGVVTNLALTPTLQSNEAHETIWGARLSELNRRLLQLTEKFGKGKKLQYRGQKPVGADHRSSKVIELEFDGAEVGGWYESRIKWPSAIRTDDPVYVQNILGQMTAQPPALSLYTALELFGHEDVEAEIDRIQQQREDPRLSPDTVATNVATASQAAPGALPGELLGAGTGEPPSGQVEPDGDTLQASASPAREYLS